MDHIVGTYDSTNDAVKGYVDSVEKLSTTGTRESANNTDGDVVIGAWYDTISTKNKRYQPSPNRASITAH